MPVIAILDDRVTNRHIYTRLSSAVGPDIEVKAFGNPQEALVELGMDPPDLIITDYKMPEMDGAEFVRAFRAIAGCTDIPIIVVTVYEERDFRLRALEAGATDFLQSPVDHHEFMTRARNLLKLRLQQKIIESRAHELEQELKTAERSHIAATRDSTERLAQVIDTIPAMVSATDRDGRYVFANAYQAALCGTTPHELVGKPVIEVLGSEAGEHLNVLDAIVFASGEPLTAFEQGIVDPDGEMRWFLTNKVPLRDTNGEVVHVLTSALEITDRKRAEEHLRHVAYHDALTGLPNRVNFREQLEQIIARPDSVAGRLAVYLVDLDRFKGVNEALGYAVGDDLIRLTGERLAGLCKEKGLLAHFGSDEFAILQQGANDDEIISDLSRQILDCVREPIPVGERALNPTASIGIARYPDDGEEADELIRSANLAMSLAKLEGGDCHHFFAAGMNRRARDAIALDFDLRRALSRNEFELHYQPQIGLQSGRIVGVEALLRWRRGGSDLVSPDQFLPYAEESGLILPISEWVLHEACREAAAWVGRGLPPLRMAVNLSPAQFRRQDVCGLVRQALQQSGLEADRLELELTENMLMQNAELVAADMAALRAIGVHFSIDDFGTGYSSLSYIKQLPISRLKIDRSFIINVAHDENDAAIVRTIVALAHSLNIAVTAEGVESSEQLDYLTTLGCDEVQGYLFSRPLPAHDCVALLSHHFAVGLKGPHSVTDLTEARRVRR